MCMCVQNILNFQRKSMIKANSLHSKMLLSARIYTTNEMKIYVSINVFVQRKYRRSINHTLIECSTFDFFGIFSNLKKTFSFFFFSIVAQFFWATSMFIKLWCWWFSIFFSLQFRWTIQTQLLSFTFRLVEHTP